MKSGPKKSTCALTFALSTLAIASHAIAPPEAKSYIADSFGISSSWTWREITTAHFRITFPTEMEGIAKQTAAHFEEAHRILGPRLHWEPSKRTQVLLYDNSDAANGLAAAALRLGVVLYITPPEPWFSTTYYDDWLKMVVFHEYTHFLNMDPTRSFWTPIRWVFGDGTLPNALLPTWMLEGHAVWNETKFTSAGRGRSPYWEGILRAAVEEKLLGSPQLVNLDLLNGDTFEFPEGEIPYLYGYQMMNQVVQSAPKDVKKTADGESAVQGPEDLLGVLSIRSSGRVPYFIQGNIKNVSGRSWSTHWREWVTETNRRLGLQLEQMKQEKQPDPYVVRRPNFDSLRAIRFSRDDQWVSWINDGSDRRTGIHVQNLKSGRELRLGDQLLGGSAVFTADSSTLIVASARRKNHFFLFDDLFAYDLSTQEVTQLSDGLRARDPDLSPDGSTLVFAMTDQQASVSLAQAPITRGTNGKWSLGAVKVLRNPGPLSRISNPRYSTDGKRVVFSEHTNGKAQEDLIELELSTGAIRPLVTDGFFNRTPVFHPQTGELHFISDRSGVDTLWKFNSKSQLPERVIQVSTGLWFPEISPRVEIHAARIGAKGWDWAVYSAEKIQPTPAEKVRPISPPPSTDSGERERPNPTCVGPGVSVPLLFALAQPRAPGVDPHALQ